MQLLADQLAPLLTFDGGEDDNRLFAETIYSDTLNMTQEQYEAMEYDLKKYSIKGNGFEVYAWADASGFKYWQKMQECNYIQITVAIHDLDCDHEEIKTLVEQAKKHFRKYELVAQ